ncbi:MAG: 5-methylthioadenosine/S-adenosylhomocysteine deaminase [Pseudomonadota bacterium]|nr:5-methylthioadenosine/S-adenosylhomocysteine deaminase [Pseudomonadota bacterium]
MPPPEASAMYPADLIISARWTIPVEPEGQVLDDHALVVRDGRIVDLLPAAEATQRYAPRELIRRPQHVLLPGLVNAHTHSPMTLFRGMADDLPLDTWLNEHIWPAEARWVDGGFVRDGAELAMLEMLQGGTTCFNDMYFFPDVIARAVDASGLRACVGMIVLEQATVWARDAGEYLRKGLAARDQFRGHPRVSMIFAPHAPYTVADDSFREIRLLANELDTQIHMHVHETASEISASQKRHARRPLQRLDELGLLTPLLAAVHMTQLTAGEIPLLASRGVSVVHCPESNLKLASGFCPIADLAAAGINIALGTDGASSNNDLDMFGEMRSCALLAKGVAQRADAAPAATVLGMATLNGAKALGLGDRIGSLVTGKEADVICVDLSAAATQPVYDPVSQLVYATSRDQVSDVWVAGRQLLADHQPLVADAPAILARAESWRARLSAARGSVAHD